MTTAMIVKWLKTQQDLKIQEAHRRYCEVMLREDEQFELSVGLEKIVNDLFLLLDRVDDVHNKWIMEMGQREDVNVTMGRWNTFWQSFYKINTREKLEKAIRAQIENVSPNLKAIEKAYDEEKHKIAFNYLNVITHVKALRSTKKSIEYLRSLGFDVSELEDPRVDEVTALAVPVDVSYLFIKKANEAGDTP